MKKFLIAMTLAFALIFSGCTSSLPETKTHLEASSDIASTEYTGEACVIVNNNVPEFTEEEKNLIEVQVNFSELDSLGRCGVVLAVLDKAHMAEGSRGSIGMYKPSGWPDKIGNAKYDFIDGKYLFNRSHLLGWQLWGDETNNEKNLITGTRQMNAGENSMLDYENIVASYLENHPTNHVVYRVTPHFKDDELIARGVQMEYWSVEDNGALSANVYIFNVQDGVEFSYYDGSSHATGETAETTETTEVKETGDTIYYLNGNTGKFHTEDCRYADSEGIETTNLTREQLIEDGYEPCKVCNP